MPKPRQPDATDYTARCDRCGHEYGSHTYGPRDRLVCPKGPPPPKPAWYAAAEQRTAQAKAGALTCCEGIRSGHHSRRCHLRDSVTATPAIGPGRRTPRPAPQQLVIVTDGMCSECGGPIPPAKPRGTAFGGKGRKRITCGDVCRQRASRRRREEAARDARRAAAITMKQTAAAARRRR